MKKYLLLFVLLLAFVLCACTSSSPGTGNGDGTDENIAASTLYPNAPDTYAPILDDFHFLAEHIQSDSEEYLDSILEEIGFVEYPYGEELAYAVIDINNDEIPELLLGTMDGLRSSAPNSVFTLKDGKPVLLISFWSRNTGVISADGTIYSIGSGGASYTYLSTLRLDKNADTLTQLTDIHSDYSELEEKPFFVQVVNGKDHDITEELFWDFFDEYDDPAERMELTIIPITN